MNENKKVLFIINKYSGASYQPGVEGRILTHCAELGLEPTLEFTQGRGHATQLARQAVESKQFAVLFAVGGDGTVNEVAQGVVNTPQVMGIIPKGSGNGLARHLGIPIPFRKSLRYIGSTAIISMDSFTINDRLSLNISGIGFDGHIANLFGKNGKRGLLGYSQLVIKEFYRYQQAQVIGEIDGRPFDQTIFVLAFANSSQFGNNARIAPRASVCDGLLDVCFLHKVPVTHAIGFIQQLFAGRLEKSQWVTHQKGKTIELMYSEPMPFHVDGEGMPAQKSFRIQINPASIRMLVPTERAENI